MAVTIDGTTGVSAVQDGVVQTADLASGAVTEAQWGGGQLSNRNLIINGAMQVSQRGTSNSSVSDGAFVIDRYSLRTSNNGWYAAEQSSDAPVGFSHSLKITSNGANTPASGAYIFFTQKIEGFNSAQLEFGTANAKTITISFYIKSSLTGTFAGSIRNSAQNRSYPYTFTISSANTWEYKTVTVAGDTTGTWIGSTNGIGLDMIFNLGSGSSNSGTVGTWAAAGYLSATGAVNLVETSGATLFMTGLQVEVGDTDTPFEHRSYGDEFQRCQRYFCKNGASSHSYYAYQYTASFKFVHVQFPVQMRAAPAVSFTMSSGSFTTYLHDEVHWKAYGSSSYTDGSTYQLNSYSFDAEL